MIWSRLGMFAYYQKKEGGGQDLSPCPGGSGTNTLTYLLSTRGTIPFPVRLFAWKLADFFLWFFIHLHSDALFRHRLALFAVPPFASAINRMGPNAARLSSSSAKDVGG